MTGPGGTTVDPAIAKNLSRIGEITLALPCVWKGKPAGIAMNATSVIVATGGVTGRIASAPLNMAELSDDVQCRRNIQLYSEVSELTFLSSQDSEFAAEQFGKLQEAYNLAIRAPEPKPSYPVLIVTMNDIPGYDITEVRGDVFGVIVRARNMFSNMGANLRTVVGGEVGGYTKLLTDSRNEARERLATAAREVGANAIVAMRFDCSEIGDVMTETVAYGTAVTIVKHDAVGRQGTPAS
jgi:uncharacterized protein YbjQ (UPF0145 family)